MKSAIFAACCFGGLLLSSSPALATNPVTSTPLEARVKKAATDLEGALQAIQQDASARVEFDQNSGFCKRTQTHFKLARGQDPQEEPAWFDFTPNDVRTDSLALGAEKVQIALLLNSGASSKISVRFGKLRAAAQPVERLALGTFFLAKGNNLMGALKNLSELCSETALNIKDIRTNLSSSGYTSSTLQGKSGSVADRCTLKVGISSLQRTMTLAGACASPRIAARIPQPEMAKALGLAPGQVLPHLSCKDDKATLPASQNEIPLRQINPTALETLQNALRFYASNQTTCGS